MPYLRVRTYSFFLGGPPNLDVEAVNVLILGFWPVVRSKVGIIIHRTAGGDGVEILGLVEVSTEEIVVEFEGLWVQRQRDRHPRSEYPRRQNISLSRWHLQWTVRSWRHSVGIQRT